MKKTISCAMLALLFAGGFGCASNKDALMEKDRLINERQQENLSLRKQLQDSRATQDLLRKQFEQQKEEFAQLNAEYEAVVAERDALRSEVEELSSARSAAPKPTIEVDDPNVDVSMRANGEVVLRVNNEVTFRPGSATLTNSGEATLARVARVLKRHPEFRISVEGHTDDTPLKATKDKWKTNMNLSIARALKVRDFLSKAARIEAQRMRVVGYGETRPLVRARTKEARAKNRRVEIVLYQGEE